MIGLGSDKNQFRVYTKLCLWIIRLASSLDYFAELEIRLRPQWEELPTCFAAGYPKQRWAMDPVLIEALHVRTKLIITPHYRRLSMKSLKPRSSESQGFTYTIFWPCHVNHHWPLEILTNTRSTFEQTSSTRQPCSSKSLLVFAGGKSTPLLLEGRGK